MNVNEPLPELQDFQRWIETPAARQDHVINVVRAKIGSDYQPIFTKVYGSGPRIATFKHAPTGIEFNLIPGGRFSMGLSDPELQTLRSLDKDNQAGIDPDSMRPVHDVTVRPFLCSRFPILEPEALNLIEPEDTDFRVEVGKLYNLSPMYLSVRETKLILGLTGFRLLSESEWEYSIRAGTRSLFYFGDSLPPDEALEKNVLLSWFDDPSRCDAAANRFGLVGLSLGQLCADAWHDDYSGAPVDGSAWTDSGEVYVTRSGAAAYWPWQSTGEWVSLASAVRFPSDQLEDGTCGVRLAKSIP